MKNDQKIRCKLFFITHTSRSRQKEGKHYDRLKGAQPNSCRMMRVKEDDDDSS